MSDFDLTYRQCPDPDAYVQILHTLSICHVALDTDDLDAFASIFTEDAEYRIRSRWEVRGRNNILAEIVRRRKGRKRTADGAFQRHHLTTRYIDIVDGEHAKGLCYWVVFTELGLDHTGRYVDRFRKVGSSWLFESREIIFDWIVENSRFGGDAATDRPPGAAS